MPSSNPAIFPPIPLETAKAARAVFGRGNFYLITGDQVDSLFAGLVLENQQGSSRRLSRRLAKLYLITIFQFVESLPDHLAADALRERSDWKYALHLPLNYPGLPARTFCEFRKRLLAHPIALQNFGTLLTRWMAITDFSGKMANLDAGQVTIVVCQFSRLAAIWEALHQAMETLATRQPEWLMAASLPHWYERYGAHRRNLDLTAVDAAAPVLAEAIGADGTYLLDAIATSGDRELADLDEVLALRDLWGEQFERMEGELSWRVNVCAGCAPGGAWPGSYTGGMGSHKEVDMNHHRSGPESSI